MIRSQGRVHRALVLSFMLTLCGAVAEAQSISRADKAIIENSFLPSIGAAADFCTQVMKQKKVSASILQKAGFRVGKSNKNNVAASKKDYPDVRVKARKWLGNWNCTVEVHNNQNLSVQSLSAWSSKRGYRTIHAGYGLMRFQMPNGQELRVGLIEISGNRIRGARFEFR